MDSAGCNLVQTGEPLRLGFEGKRGSCYYMIFEKPISNKVKAYYGDVCTYIMLNDKIILQYHNGLEEID